MRRVSTSGRFERKLRGRYDVKIEGGHGDTFILEGPDRRYHAQDCMKLKG